MSRSVILLAIFTIISVRVIYSCINNELKYEGNAISWYEILDPANRNVPSLSEQLAWQPKIEWFDNMDQAMQQAQQNYQPLFVTMRCIPCKQCSDFDKDVLENDGMLKEVLRNFVTVRLTSIRDIDLRLFPIDGFQDLDLSWWGWFFSPEGRTYGIYGGRDHVSDTTRMSVASLTLTCNRILAHHYDSRRNDWNIDGPIPDLSNTPITPLQLPGWKSWYSKAPQEYQEQTCLHCHQVSEVLRQPLIDKKLFNKHTDFDIWPLPENVGLIVNRDHGLLVDSVIPNSPAYKAGIIRNDILGAAGNRKLFSQADFMGVLHRGPKGKGTIPIYWLRGDEILKGQLELEDGWRKTILEWRKSVAEAAVGAHWGGGWPLRANSELRRKFKIANGEMSINPWFGNKPKGRAYEAGLRPFHTVIAVNGEKPEKHGRAFNLWFRMNYEPDDQITLTVLDKNGNQKFIKYKL